MQKDMTVAGSSTMAIALAEGVLSVLFAKPSKFQKIHQGDNAISFEVNNLPKDFEPKNVTIINRVKTSKTDNSEFYVLRVKSKLVRMFVMHHETALPSVSGAIYTGDDESFALSLAMKMANRLKV